MLDKQSETQAKKALKNLDIRCLSISWGRVEVKGNITQSARRRLKARLSRFGMELLNVKTSNLIEEIEIQIIDFVYHSENLPKENFSEYLSEKLNYDYTYLANLFSEVKGIPIKQAVIIHKIERAKKLLLHDKLKLKEISVKLNYSSVAHLSNQFKKVTGHIPSAYLKVKGNKNAKGNLEKV